MPFFYVVLSINKPAKKLKGRAKRGVIKRKHHRRAPMHSVGKRLFYVVKRTTHCVHLALDPCLFR